MGSSGGSRPAFGSRRCGLGGDRKGAIRWKEGSVKMRGWEDKEWGLDSGGSAALREARRMRRGRAGLKGGNRWGWGKGAVGQGDKRRRETWKRTTKGARNAGEGAKDEKEEATGARATGGTYRVHSSGCKDMRPQGVERQAVDAHGKLPPAASVVGALLDCGAKGGGVRVWGGINARVRPQCWEGAHAAWESPLPRFCGGG